LLIEIARRQQYREAADKVVQTMMAQLESMSEGVVACLFVLTFSTGMKLTLTNEQKSGKSETSST
jgi:hypothetical protein